MSSVFEGRVRAPLRSARIPRTLASMRRVRRSPLALLALALLAACGDDTGLGPDPEKATFDASLGIDLSKMTKLSSGVYIQTISAGTGTATVKLTDRITAEYKGWLANGTVFDPGTAPITNQPISTNGFANFIPGFAYGLEGMKVGEVRKIVIPAALGYGENPPARSGIPKNAVLVFQVTLRAINP